MAFEGKEFEMMCPRILIWFSHLMVPGIMGLGLTRYQQRGLGKAISFKSLVQSVCEEAAHTSEGLRKLFGPKDSDTGTYFRQVVSS